MLRANGNERILLSDVVERFAKRPFGWPDAEILLLMGRLAATGQISFQLGGGTLPVHEAFEPLQNSRRRREVSIIKKRQTDEAVLKQARQLTQSLFASVGPTAEKELFEFYRQHLSKWLVNLKSYKTKADVGRFPQHTTTTITQSILSIERLLSHSDSFDFFKHVVDKKNDYLDLEEDYRDLEAFFSHQLGTWNLLQQALQQFEVNRQFLKQDEQAARALSELHQIASAASPYGSLNKVGGLVDQVKTVNERLLAERRAAAVQRIDGKIKQLETEIHQSGIHTAALSNRLLLPLQQLKDELGKDRAIAGIYLLQTETLDERFDESLDLLDQAQEAERLRLAKAQQPSKPSAAAEPSGRPATTSSTQPSAQQPTPVAAKPVVEVNIAELYGKTVQGVYLDTHDSVDQFVDALRAELKQLVGQQKRVRIR